jgi:hypothetical protein
VIANITNNKITVKFEGYDTNQECTEKQVKETKYAASVEIF